MPYQLPSTIVAGLLATMSFDTLQSESIHYRFTGTIEEEDPSIGFSSPENFIRGLTVQAGDQVSGSFVLTIGNPNIALDPGFNMLEYARDVTEMRLSIEGQELFTESTPAGNAILLNSPANENPFIEVNPLANSLGDLLSITTRFGGVTVGGQDRVGVVLNLTDTTGELFGPPLRHDAPFPEPITLAPFDITKGFLMSWSDSMNQADSGIMFNIDSLEVVDPNPAPPVELVTGFHVRWPTDAGEHILEESETPNGPWIRSEASSVTVNGENIVVMDLSGRSKFYRLVEPN